MKKNTLQVVQSWLIKGFIAHLFLVFSGASFANVSPVGRQGILQEKITLHVQDMKIKNVLKEIEKRCSTRFGYQHQIFNLDRKVTLSVEESPLIEVLNKLFDHAVSFEDMGGLVIIKRLETEAILSVPIKGKVTDETGAPMLGVNVQELGTTNGTTTNTEGNYSISVENSTSVLIYSFIGYETQEIVVGSNTTIDIRMSAKHKQLDEVVVTANTSRRAQQVIPMSISKFTADQLPNLKFNSQADILRNVPGVTAEGGGGEVASNILVRGLPSGGAYTFTPIQIDGMPVISTMGLNSSAPDVYFRNDLGISGLEFVRGGSSTLYGIGSVAGIINYISKVGTEVPKTVFETEVASPGKFKMDFNTGAPLGAKGVYYNVSGTYRYDTGPLVSGIPSTGYQLRANIRKVTDNGSFTMYGQYIHDKVQFFVPYPLTNDRLRPEGYDGKLIKNLETADAANLSVLTPNGYYQSHAERGTYTNGGYLMAAFQHDFEGEWQFDAKVRIAKYQHEFNFFNTDGNGKNPLTQAAYVTNLLKGAGTNYRYTYANDGTVMDPTALVLENTIADRNRPLTELAANVNLGKSFQIGATKQNITIGGFAARTEANDFVFQMSYLSEFKDQPRIIDVNYTDANGVVRDGTRNGVLAAPGYTNRFSSSNKTALYLTDEINIGRFNIDFGARVENQTGRVEAEKSAKAANAHGVEVTWGTGRFNRFNLQASDWAVATGVSYRVSTPLNIYANFSRGYFFPNYNGFNVIYADEIPIYPKARTEHIVQGEAGAKFSGNKVSATLATFYAKLNDRFNVFILNVGGALTEVAFLQDSRSLGIEGTWNWSILKNLRLEGSATYQVHKYTQYVNTPTNVGNWLERQPRLILNGGLLYNNKKIDAAFSINAVGKRYGNASNQVELDPYNISRLDAGYTYRMSRNENVSTVRVGAGVFNLFNTLGITEGNPRAGDAQTNSGNFFVGRPILSRSFFARITVTF